MDSYLRRHSANPISMFERTQLFERFGPLERRLWERGEQEQEIASKGVKPDMLVDAVPRAGCACVTPERDGRPREVESVAEAVHNDLHDVRARDFGGVARVGAAWTS